MELTYDDIVDVQNRMRRDGRTIAEIRLTYDTYETFRDFMEKNAVTASNKSEVRDGALGVISGQSVVEGGRDVAVAEDGTEYEL